MSFLLETGHPLDGRRTPPRRVDGATVEIEGGLPAAVVLLVATDQSEEVVVALGVFGPQREGQFVGRRPTDDGVPQLERPHGLGVEFIRPEDDHTSG